ncbi:hypothetical protein GCM10023144_21550 [Pigmentiphaga soli]|uniref:Periplasmic binding protein domain-containing protein n=1 Tax=Pigmentiphaga soli TaxID=1007095 RepID=A0ABP8GZ67_9BURK
MPTRRNVLMLLSSYLGLACFPAFAQPKKKRIAFANYNDESSFGVLILRGVQAAAKARPDVEMLYYDNKQDAAQAVAVARQVATVRPDAFIEYNSIATAANQQVARLIEAAKVPMLSVQVRVANTPLFAVDNELAGYESGKGLAAAAKARWPGAVPQVLIIGLPESGQIYIDRAEAARKAILEAFPGAKVEDFSSKNDPNVARQIATDFLTKNPGKKAIIWAHIDAVGIASITAARNSGREQDVLVSSTGGEVVAFPEIRKPNSSYVGTFSFFPESWGKDMLEAAIKLADKQPIPDIVRPSKQLFIDKSNIDTLFPK